MGKRRGFMDGGDREVNVFSFLRFLILVCMVREGGCLVFGEFRERLF